MRVPSPAAVFAPLELHHPRLRDPSLPLPPPPNVPAHTLLPRFSHIPPRTVRGRARWPISLEYQAFPMDQTPTLRDVLIWVTPYLEPPDNQKVHGMATDYRLGPEY